MWFKSRRHALGTMNFLILYLALNTHIKFINKIRKKNI